MNYTQLTQLSDTIGKTIARWDDENCIIFTDDTFLVIWGDGEGVMAERNPLIDVQLQNFGLISYTEFEKRLNEQQ